MHETSSRHVKQIIEMFYLGRVAVENSDRDALERIMKAWRIKGVYRKVVVEPIKTESVAITVSPAQNGHGSNGSNGNPPATNGLNGNNSNGGGSLTSTNGSTMNGAGAATPAVKVENGRMTTPNRDRFTAFASLPSVSVSISKISDVRSITSEPVLPSMTIQRNNVPALEVQRNVTRVIESPGNRAQTMDVQRKNAQAMEIQRNNAQAMEIQRNGTRTMETQGNGGQTMAIQGNDVSTTNTNRSAANGSAEMVIVGSFPNDPMIIQQINGNGSNHGNNSNGAGMINIISDVVINGARMNGNGKETVMEKNQVSDMDDESDSEDDESGDNGESMNIGYF